ncbi:MAG: hypothetical protein AABX39_01140 [Nanoarchaeota archaeon]
MKQKNNGSSIDVVVECENAPLLKQEDVKTSSQYLRNCLNSSCQEYADSHSYSYSYDGDVD